MMKEVRGEDMRMKTAVMVADNNDDDEKRGFLVLTAMTRVSMVREF